jgi:hypothetical protein
LQIFFHNYDNSWTPLCGVQTVFPGCCSSWAWADVVCVCLEYSAIPMTWVLPSSEVFWPSPHLERKHTVLGFVLLPSAPQDCEPLPQNAHTSLVPSPTGLDAEAAPSLGKIPPPTQLSPSLSSILFTNVCFHSLRALCLSLEAEVPWMPPSVS